jgi:hypothetical protein
LAYFLSIAPHAASRGVFFSLFFEFSFGFFISFFFPFYQIACFVLLMSSSSAHEGKNNGFDGQPQAYVNAATNANADSDSGGIDELTTAKDVYPETQLLLVHPDDLTTTLEQAQYMGPRLIFEREIEHFNVLERTAAAKAAHRAAINAARRH